VLKKIKPLQAFDQYLKFGAYPFSLEGEEYYYQKLSNVVNLVLEIDLPAIDNITFGTVVKLRKLLYVLAEVVPFTPNISELSDKIGVTREQLYRFLYLLEKAEIIYMLRKHAKGMSMMAKPEKIYLHNPNLAEALTHSKTNTGTLRETFFINQLSSNYEVNYSSQGDFLINNQYVFEIGGRNKGKKQIKDAENSYLVKDGIEHGTGEIVPLWLFGFLY
jgi:predicted AAA+ superfamily ATPase